MMGHQTGDAVTSTNPAQKASTIERVKPGVGHSRSIANVVQPGRRYQSAIVQLKSLSNMLRPVSNALDMPPAERQPGQMPLSERFRVTNRHHSSERRCYHNDKQTPVRDLAPHGSDRRMHYAADQVKVLLVRPDRKDERRRFGNLAGMRQWIEAAFDTLKGQLDLEWHRGRTLARVFTRTAQRLLAMAACIWHNWRTGAPQQRSLIAYDH